MASGRKKNQEIQRLQQKFIQLGCFFLEHYLFSVYMYAVSIEEHAGDWLLQVCVIHLLDNRRLHLILWKKCSRSVPVNLAKSNDILTIDKPAEQNS